MKTKTTNMTPPEFESALGGLINSAIMGGLHPAIVSGILAGKQFQIHLTMAQNAPQKHTVKKEMTAENGDSPIIKLPPGTRLPPQPSGGQ